MEFNLAKSQWEQKYNKKLDPLFSGCLVIGNAPTVLLNEWGSLVDNFECVIRLNSYKIKGYENYIGTKTNIWARAKNYEIAFRDGTKFEEVWLKDGWNRTNRDSKVYKFTGPPVINYEKSNVKIMKERQLVRKIDGRNCNVTTGFLAILVAIEKFQNDNKPVTTYGFNFFGGNDKVDCKRPHYYREEPPSLYGGFKKPFNTWMHHPIEEEREYALNLYKQGKINLLFEEEVLNTSSLDLSHLDETILKEPDHLVNIPESLRVKY